MDAAVNSKNNKKWTTSKMYHHD